MTKINRLINRLEMHFICKLCWLGGVCAFYVQKNQASSLRAQSVRVRASNGNTCKQQPIKVTRKKKRKKNNTWIINKNRRSQSNKWVVAFTMFRSNIYHVLGALLFFNNEWKRCFLHSIQHVFSPLLSHLGVRSLRPSLLMGWQRKMTQTLTRMKTNKQKNAHTQKQQIINVLEPQGEQKTIEAHLLVIEPAIFKVFSDYNIS